MTRRAADPDEEEGALTAGAVQVSHDVLSYGEPMPEPVGPPGTLSAVLAVSPVDTDRDCLPDSREVAVGTDPRNPDTDGDGWFDGPCNERRKLVLEGIKAYDEQEDAGEDELYLVADDVRFPHADMDGYWSFDDGQSRSFNTVLATRTRGRNATRGLQVVQLEGWEDDVEVWNEWTVDDLLFAFTVDLGRYVHGQRFKLRHRADDWDYELSLRVEVEYFADPNPRQDADGDGDGIRESDEARVSGELGGITDPARQEVLVEVDSVTGRFLSTEAKRLVVTQLYRSGVHLHVWRHQALPPDGCISVPDARALYASSFNRQGYGAFRYCVVANQLWNDASGVAWGDMFLVDDSTWWIDGDVLAQAGTFLHELGHTMSLRQPRGVRDTGPGTYAKIDTVGWLAYDSAMNYTYQALLVDFSHDGAGGRSSDHNDWEDVDPAYGLAWSFSRVTSVEMGVCR
jgi:hypothetical protein